LHNEISYLQTPDRGGRGFHVAFMLHPAPIDFQGVSATTGNSARHGRDMKSRIRLQKSVRRIAATTFLVLPKPLGISLRVRVSSALCHPAAARPIELR
jgi:hypothetical protein